MFQKILVANRGAIACRIIRTLDRMGIASVAVYSDADRHARHVRMAGHAVRIGPPRAAESYLNVEAVIEAARATGAEAIHPGYGFLSENANFAEACREAGIVFIGPRPEHMRAFGLKHEARALAQAAGVPLAPGSGLVESLTDAQRAADAIGYPVMLKSTAGGGGIGLQRVHTADELPEVFARVSRLARNNFKEAGIFVEKYVARGRHIEVQIFGDGKGKVLALGERDCSAQRRNQKVIEETPAPNLADDARAALWETAVRLGRSVSYENAGTVEFLYDDDARAFYFLEVNTRLQVEHGVTEEVLGIDLVEWMIRQAAGEPLRWVQSDVKPKGAAIQVRIYAEDPAREFRPSAGILTEVTWPQQARIESWVERGTEVTSHYDPMLAKLIVEANDRQAALNKLRATLNQCRLSGIACNLRYLRAIAHHDAMEQGRMLTTTLGTLPYTEPTIEVLSPGTQTTVQDWPGRLHYWAVGVPPSGPMDDRSMRLANRIVGNAEDAAALEMTLTGPTLRFNANCIIALSGADMGATLDGARVERFAPIEVNAGQTLMLGSVDGGGVRAYLAIRGGLDVPDYLGSKSTFTLGRFGGHGGRALLKGDVLYIDTTATCDATAHPDPEIIPELVQDWDIGVLYGPHGAPEFFTESDIETLFEFPWEVHYNSSRTGVRLIGPKPQWARADGGEAGLHPSNIHDNPYAIGAIDFTGDMPVILGPDGPSLGGFVCPATVVQAELWKIGQLRPGNRVRFRRLTPQEAHDLRRCRAAELVTLQPQRTLHTVAASTLGADGCILGVREKKGDCPRVIYRRQGDTNVLIEYGPIVLDLALRLRVHALMTALERLDLGGILDLTPGIRSLQIHFDPDRLAIGELIDRLVALEEQLAGIEDTVVPSRILHMPLSWDDPAVQETIRRYEMSVRDDAPWCPSNIEFIRRINGLDDVADVKRIIFEASYLVLGLGDVYLGAPVATPLDPRHRLVTTKYNPARTWTPDNVVGIGGAYMCIYGMEGPGGYQLFGRTCQVWNTYGVTQEFRAGQPWLLRFFDQIRFFEVSSEELAEFRDRFLSGQASLKIEETQFSWKKYAEFLRQEERSITSFKACQQAAFDEERRRWQQADRTGDVAEPHKIASGLEGVEIPDGACVVTSPVPGNVWRVLTAAGQYVCQGDTLFIVESMKTEIAVTAAEGGVVTDVRCAEGRSVALGETLALIQAPSAVDVP